MISTRILLLLAALALACIAVINGEVQSDCNKVTSTSFPLQGAQPTLASVLGERCKKYNSTTEELDGTWIGYNTKSPQNCKVCCARKDDKGNLHYTLMAAPANFPCGKNKKCLNGVCK
uniref:Putative secreted protein n=1 Tax=Ixodes ricinus TaxID=34613 RepID=V5HB49_IXORI